MKRFQKLGMVAVLALGACATDASIPTPPSPGTPANDFQTFRGKEARNFTMPSDLVLVSSRDLDKDKTYQRYQQMFGDAKVFGAQITVHKNRHSGENNIVIGTHHDSISPANRVVLDDADVTMIASNAVADATEFIVDLMINAESGRYYYNVESRGDALRDYLWIDAETGDVLNHYDGLTANCDTIPGGIGYRDKQIDLAGMVSGDASSGYTLDSGRQVTRDLGSQKKPFYGTADQDADGCYDLVDRESPGQGALVSAHVNVAKTDAYYLDKGFDMLTELQKGDPSTTSLTVWAHKDVNYVNAYWDGRKMVFGDGNGTTFRELVSIDIAAHEFTHGYTNFTSNLVYQDESGALNESFSDIIGAVLEFQEDGEDSDYWLMGEDADLDGLGFRSMIDPTLHGHPKDYCQRYTGTSDNGGVHSNSGISNHAFYRLVTDANGVDLATAADIFYHAFPTLGENATFLNARSATETIAAAADLTADPTGVATTQFDAVVAAWDAVNVGPDVVCDTAPPAPDCSADEVCNDECAEGQDPDCSTGGGTCTLKDAGEACVDNAECCSNKCKGKAGSKSCK